MPLSPHCLYTSQELLSFDQTSLGFHPWFPLQEEAEVVSAVTLHVASFPPPFLLPLVSLPSPSPTQHALQSPLIKPYLRNTSCGLELPTNFLFLPQQHLNENLAKLTAKFEKATAEKLRCQQEAEVTAGTISLANRLVSLSSDYISSLSSAPGM